MTVWLTTVCTEREPDGTYEDCTWASAVMMANEAYAARKYPQTQAEYEALRAASGDVVRPGDSGSNIGDVTKGMTARYGWTGQTLTTWAAIAAKPVGTAFILQGLYSKLPTFYRRWSKFTGAHAVCVVKIEKDWWWLDPLAPRDFIGDAISEAVLKGYYLGLSGARAMAVTVGERKEDDVQITSVVAQNWTANGDNGVLRATPDRSAPVTDRLAPGQAIVSSAEWVTADGYSWRLAEWPIGSRIPRWFIRYAPGIPANHDFIAGSLVVPVVCPPPIDCTPLIEAARQEAAQAAITTTRAADRKTTADADAAAKAILGNGGLV